MALNFLNNGAFTGKLNVETTGISNTAIFENSGQSFSYTAIKVGEALGNRANLTFVVGDNLAATDLIGEIGCLITSDGGALEGAMSFKTNSGDTLTERMVISSAGALRFNAYGAGTLITDASGNITVSSGGGSGGPYLPLIGGTLSGDLTANGNVVLGGSAADPKEVTIQQISVTATENTAIMKDGNGVLKSRTLGTGAFGPTPVGAFLPLAGGTMTGVTQFNDHTQHGDQVQARWGADNDLIIEHDGYNSYIRDLGVGDLLIDSNGASLKLRVNSTENALIANSNGSVELYYDGSKKFETTAAGATVTGEGIFTGDVGIGTTDPSARLQVDKGSSGNVAGFKSNATAINEYAGITLHSQTISGVDWYGSEIRSINTAGTPGSLNPRLGFFTQDNNTYLPANRTEKMSILGNGNVGIGTTNPDAKLDIEALNPRIRLTSSKTGLSDEDTVGAIDFYTSDASSEGQAVNVKIEAFADDIYGRMGLRFYTGGAGNPTEKMRIAHGGNVGIGTTAPGEKLEVEGTVYATPITYSANQDAYALKIGASNNVAFDMGVKIKSTSGGVPYMSFRSASTEDVIVVGGSNVGIGTTNPLSKLHVAGGTSTQTTLTIGANGTNSDKSSKLFFNEGENGVTDSKKFGFSVAYDGQGSQYPGLAANEFGIIRHNNSVNGDVVMKIARTSNNATFIGNVIGNGNIGLGTTNPVSQLNSTKVIKLQSTGNGEVILDHTDAGTASDLGLYSWERNNDHLAHIKATCEGSTTAAFISFHAQPSGGSFANPAANEKMRISSSGNVTIQGTTTASNFILSSDERLKENIKEVCDNRIKADWKTFELKTERGQKRYGVIAQELEKTNPEFVREDTQGFKSVAYIDLLIAKIAELEARLEKAGI